MDLKFNKGDYVICEVKKHDFDWNGSLNKSHPILTYKITTKKGIISGTNKEGNYGFLYLVKCDNGDQNYFYEKNISIDIVKTRDEKLKQIGL
jgi:hypothetical protein